MPQSIALAFLAGELIFAGAFIDSWAWAKAMVNKTRNVRCRVFSPKRFAEEPNVLRAARTLRQIAGGFK